MTGWIKLHRKILHSSMYQQLNAKQRDVMMTVLLMANYEPNQWEHGGEFYEVKPGQFVTSLKSIKENCGSDVTIQNVRTALDKLKRWGFLTWESSNKNRLITITNWEVYQSDDEKEKPEPEQEKTPDPEPEQSKEKEKDGEAPPKRKTSNQYNTEFEELWKAYPRKKGKTKARQAYSKHRKQGYTLADFQKALERYKAEIERKETPTEYIKHGSTFFNSGFEDYLENNDGEVVQIEPQRVEMPGMDFLQKRLEEACANL